MQFKKQLGKRFNQLKLFDFSSTMRKSFSFGFLIASTKILILQHGVDTNRLLAKAVMAVSQTQTNQSAMKSWRLRPYRAI